MSWIKRNLYFLIGSLVAVGLMVVGVFYLLGAISKESQIAEEIAKQYSELERLNKQDPHPGEAGTGKVDNVAAAKEQEKAIKAYIEKARPFFHNPPPIPDSPKVGKEEFKAQLANTVAQLARDANQASVVLPKDYQFTFESQRHLMNFDAANLDRLAASLGEIKAIATILINAKVNSIEGIRRELISTNDDKNPSDYHARKTVSTPLADLTPYEVTFRGFSAELAAVMTGLANSPYCLIVKTINVEPGGSGSDPNAPAAVSFPVAPVQPYVPPAVYSPTAQREAYTRRYGGAAPYTPPVVASAPAAPSAPAVPRGPVMLLNEKPLRITLGIEVVKLKAAK